MSAAAANARRRFSSPSAHCAHGDVPCVSAGRRRREEEELQRTFMTSCMSIGLSAPHSLSTRKHMAFPSCHLQMYMRACVVSCDETPTHKPGRPVLEGGVGGGVRLVGEVLHVEFLGHQAPDPHEKAPLKRQLGPGAIHPPSPRQFRLLDDIQRMRPSARGDPGPGTSAAGSWAPCLRPTKYCAHAPPYETRARWLSQPRGMCG